MATSEQTLDVRAPSTPPVGVRDGDVLIIGVDSGMSDGELEHFVKMLREALGVRVRAVILPGHCGVTTLRPERS